MFESIKGSNNWKSIVAIEKGWSSDKKYHVTTEGGVEYLLRISKNTLYEKKKRQFELLKEVEKLDVNASKAIDFGILNTDEIYMLLTWLPGEDAETAILKCNDLEQYNMGLKAGKMMSKLHSINVNQFEKYDWFKKYKEKIYRKIEMINKCEVDLPKKDLIIEYIEKNIHLVMDRTILFQHGDFHLGNMIMYKGGLGIIDFDKNSIADPYDEFKPYCWNVLISPFFETGIIDGYFNHEIPSDFFPILALYSAESLIGHLPWAIKFGKEEVETALRVAKYSLEWFNDYKTCVPTWYRRPDELMFKKREGKGEEI